MNNLNSVLLEGYLTRDPQEKSIEGSALSSFSVASNRFYKKNGAQVQETSFINVDVWGKTAEYCNQYLKKGSGVRVIGRLKQERWVDTEEKNHSTIKIVAEHVDFFNSKQKYTSSKDTKNQNDPIPSETEQETVPIE